LNHNAGSPDILDKLLDTFSMTSAISSSSVATMMMNDKHHRVKSPQHSNNTILSSSSSTAMMKSPNREKVSLRSPTDNHYLHHHGIVHEQHQQHEKPSPMKYRSRIDEYYRMTIPNKHN
jgi:hypothetical protein